MKKFPRVLGCVGVLMAVLLVLAVSPSFGVDDEFKQQTQAAIDQFKKTDSGIKAFFGKARGYAVIPTVGKGGIGIGAARGRGLVYEGGKLIGEVKLTQVTVGAQLGGQTYSEVVFLENKETATKLGLYTGLGFEVRDVHWEPVENERYTKLFVFHEEGESNVYPSKARFSHQFVWGQNDELFERLKRINQGGGQAATTAGC